MLRIAWAMAVLQADGFHRSSNGKGNTGLIQNDRLWPKADPHIADNDDV